MPVQVQAAIAEVSPRSDTAVARAIGAGDHEAFQSVMKRHSRLLYRTARSIVNDDCAAEDVLQRAYLHAYGNVSTFDGKLALSTWLVRIVIEEARAVGTIGKNL